MEGIFSARPKGPPATPVARMSDADPTLVITARETTSNVGSLTDPKGGEKMRNHRGNGLYQARYTHDESGHAFERKVVGWFCKRGYRAELATAFQDEVGKIDFRLEGRQVQLTTGAKSTREQEELNRRGINLVTIDPDLKRYSYREEVEAFIVEEVLRQAGLL